MKKKPLISLLLTLCLTLGLLTGCGADSGVTKDMVAAAPEEMAVAQDFLAENSLTESGAGSGSTALPENRKWIVTVNMSAETEDLDALLASLDEQIAALNGYVEDQSIHNGSAYASRRYRSASLTVRIPAEDVDSFTQEVEGLANVVSHNKSLEDVTLNYTSTETRVEALETEEQRLLELMEQAETMADLLEIEARLTEVRYELENYGSQLKLYDNQIDYATIYLDIEEVQEYTPVEEPTLWERISGGFVDSVKGLGESLLDIVVWIIVASPYILVYGGILTVIVVLLRKWRKARKAKKAAPPGNKE